MPLTERTLADHMKVLGYATACIGKWHLGGAAQYHPLNLGFDEFYGFLHEGHFFVPPPYKNMNTRLRVNEPPYDDENPIVRGTQPITEPEYLTQALTREAVSFIERNANRPFFLYLPYNAVHSPMQAPTAAVRKFNSMASETNTGSCSLGCWPSWMRVWVPFWPSCGLWHCRTIRSLSS